MRASHGRTQAVTLVEKKVQSKGSHPPRGPQRLLQALYRIPQASLKLLVKVPSLATRKDELGADKNSEAASIAHCVKLKVEAAEAVSKDA